MGTDERLQDLRKRRAQIDAEVNLLEARLRVEQRKADTRRKILIGALVMQEMERRADFDGWVRKLLERGLSRPRDRELFGLGEAAMKHGPAGSKG